MIFVAVDDFFITCIRVDEVFTYLIKEIERDSGLLEESDESRCTML